MNIKSVNNFYFTKSNLSVKNNTNPLSVKRNNPSFGQTTIRDSFEQQYENNIDKYMVYAEIFFDTIENVAKELDGYGLVFDREYAMQSPVKSAKSMSSKVERSGSFDVPDLIRTTLYFSNPYDTDFINKKFLPSMEEHGYVLAKVNGKPDIDFRLEGVGSPQKSGYEDIQMRFIEKKAKKNKIKYELIILFGPNYAQAKHLESEKVYNLIRQFDELHIDFTEAPIGSDQFKAQRYIQLIKTQAQNKISKKLFDNAKNKDFYNICEMSPITFTPQNKTLINNYFSALKDKTKNYYKHKKINARNSQLSLIQLRKEEKDDINLINYISSMFNATIKYFEKNPQ